MHILFLSDNFPPEVNAPASRTFEHCKEWVKVGHKVTVITCAPNFPRGKVYEGYKNSFWHCESKEGINVIRVWSYIAANQGFLKRTIDYLSFMLASIFASLFVRNVNIVIGTSPQFFTACSACIVGFLKRIPWIFELRDIWPESIKAIGMMTDGIALTFLERIELFLYKNANAIVSVTNSFKDILIERGVDANKIFIVTNGVDISHFSPREKDRELVKKLHLENKFIVGYVGTHGLAHGLDTVLDAANILENSGDGEKIKIIFIGDGAMKDDLINRSKENNITKILFLDSVSKSDVVKYWSLLDASIIHLKKVELFNTVIPSKLFESMAMGIPVLHGVGGESSQIVMNESVGMIFEAENSAQLASKIIMISSDEKLFNLFKENGPKAASAYSRKNLSLKMLEIISSVAKP